MIVVVLSATYWNQLYVYTITYFAKLYRFYIKNKNNFVTFFDTFLSKKKINLSYN